MFSAVQQEGQCMLTYTHNSHHIASLLLEHWQLSLGLRDVVLMSKPLVDPNPNRAMGQCPFWNSMNLIKGVQSWLKSGNLSVRFRQFCEPSSVSFCIKFFGIIIFFHNTVTRLLIDIHCSGLFVCMCSKSVFCLLRLAL